MHSNAGFLKVFLHWTFEAFNWCDTSFKISISSFNQGLKKLSYAQVCQKMAKDPPPPNTPSPTPPASSPVQPLQEVKVNRVEEPRPKSKYNTERPHKSGDNRPPRQPLHSLKATNNQGRFGGPGAKNRDYHRGKTFSPRQGARWSGKEQNIPPRSPKWPVSCELRRNLKLHVYICK